MPKHVLEDVQITLSGVDISNRVRRVNLITTKRSPQNATAMGDNWEENIGVDVRGFRASLELMQDYSTTSVYGVLGDLLDSTGSTGVPIILRHSTAIRSVTNPEFTGSVLLDGDFAFMNAEFGGLNMAPVNLIGTGPLTRLTSSS